MMFVRLGQLRLSNELVKPRPMEFGFPIAFYLRQVRSSHAFPAPLFSFNIEMVVTHFLLPCKTNGALLARQNLLMALSNHSLALKSFASLLDGNLVRHLQCSTSGGLYGTNAIFLPALIRLVTLFSEILVMDARPPLVWTSECFLLHFF